MRVGDIPRNDIETALRFVNETLDSTGDLSPDVCRVLLLLQDEPTELLGALEKLYTHRQAEGRAVPKNAKVSA